MEQERNILHVLQEHSVLLFFIAAVILMLIFLGVGFLIGRRMEKREREQRPDKF